MRPNEGIEPEVSDVGTMLFGIGSRLRVLAAAIRGVAADRGDEPEGAEGRVASELAGDLESISRRLDLVLRHLCQPCQVAEVVESVTIERREDGAPTKPEKEGRRRRSD